MKLRISNTLTRSIEEFVPINPEKITMYVCGPTVYDRPHIGNVRSAVIYDMLYRTLKSLYSNVTYVRNITDVDDKIIAAASQTNEDITELTSRITGYYHEDLKALNCLSPTIEPKATEHIQEMIEAIEELLRRGFAYVAENHVLFAVDKYKEYGLLSKRSLEEMEAGARVEVAPYKKNPGDFVLWKPSKPGEEMVSFDSPWGRGRPGWHIECCAMSTKYLGYKFDIHGGGADLMFPHHENELAQAACAYDNCSYAKYWIHNGFLTVGGEKMSKSLGNFVLARDILDSGISGITLRYFYLATHYRKPLDYNKKALYDAQKAHEKFLNILSSHEGEKGDVSEILSCLADDINTPKALGLLHSYATNGEVAKLRAGLKLLGLDETRQPQSIPQEVVALAEERKNAKQNKDWALADRLRIKIESMGYTIKDTPTGEYSLTVKMGAQVKSDQYMR